MEKQGAWAVGLRGSRRFAFNDHISISPFFGPAYARVRALDEATESPVSIGHLMLLGGIAVEAGPVEFTVFGSHSFFSLYPVGLETHVDFEEMTHFAAYEDNDGFARNTVGAELSIRRAIGSRSRAVTRGSGIRMRHGTLSRSRRRLNSASTWKCLPSSNSSGEPGRTTIT